MSTKEKIESLEETLDSYEVKLGLIWQNFKCDVLSVSPEEFKGWTATDLSEAAIKLSFLSFNIQKEINKHAARKGWATRELKLKAMEKGGSGNFWDKQNFLIAKDEYCRKLYELISKAETVLERLSFYPARIEEIRKSIEGLRYAKKTSE